MKAYIIKNDLGFKKIHDLIELLNICKKQDNSFFEIFDHCKMLAAFYIDTRYPVYWPSLVSKEEAVDAQKSALKIKNFIESKIGK